MRDMLDIRLFGKFRKFAKNSKPTDNSILNLPFEEDETFEKLLGRIGIKPADTGELLVNFSVAELDTIIPIDKCRVSIFPVGMVLLCGASHLKGHGYTKKGISVDYYGRPEIKAKLDPVGAENK